MVKKIVTKTFPTKYKTIEEEIELWECPNCKGTLFKKEHLSEIIKEEGLTIVQTIEMPLSILRGGMQVICINCGYLMERLLFG